MRCLECGQEFGIFDSFIPVFQISLDRDRDVQMAGYSHGWHYKNPDPPYEG